MSATDLLKNPEILSILNKIANLWGSRVALKKGFKLTEKHILAILDDAKTYKMQQEAFEILMGDCSQDWRPAHAIAEDAYAL